MLTNDEILQRIIVEILVDKHLAGKHNQKTHGVEGEHPSENAPGVRQRISAGYAKMKGQFNKWEKDGTIKRVRTIAGVTLFVGSLGLIAYTLGTDTSGNKMLEHVENVNRGKEPLNGKTTLKNGTEVYGGTQTDADKLKRTFDKLKPDASQWTADNLRDNKLVGISLPDSSVRGAYNSEAHTITVNTGGGILLGDTSKDALIHEAAHNTWESIRNNSEVNSLLENYKKAVSPLTKMERRPNYPLADSNLLAEEIFTHMTANMLGRGKVASALYTKKEKDAWKQIMNYSGWRESGPMKSLVAGDDNEPLLDTYVFTDGKNRVYVMLPAE